MRIALVFFLSAGMFALDKAHALTVTDIIRRVEAQPSLDTINMRVSVSVSGAGFTSNTQTHLITKGPHKTWMELETPLGRQRIIRNGIRCQVTDLNTGKTEFPPIPPEVGNFIPSQAMNASLLRAGHYEAPREMGAGLYQIILVPGTDTTVESREVTFDEGSGQIVRIKEVGKQANTTVTTIDFTGGSTLPVPTTMTVETMSQGRTVTVLMRFQNVVKPASISEKLFEIN